MARPAFDSNKHHYTCYVVRLALTDHELGSDDSAEVETADCSSRSHRLLMRGFVRCLWFGGERRRRIDTMENHRPDTEQTPSILVVEDDPAVRRTLMRILSERGRFQLDHASDGPGTLERVRTGNADLVLLDLGLPSGCGLDVLRELRSSSDVPVIVVSGRAQVTDRVLGLELGADDYLVKPVEPVELIARCRAVLRRRRPSPATLEGTAEVIEVGSVRIDRAQRTVKVDGQPVVGITTREFDLLAHLTAAPGRVHSRTQLLEHVWGNTWQDPSTVTEHVRRIRNKLGDAPDSSNGIVTVRGVGYRYIA